MLLHRFFTILLATFIGIFSTVSHAQNATAKSERRQNLTFEDELVQGSAQKPELFFLFQKKNFNYGKLIKLRENFLPEMRQTAEDVQQFRSTP